MKLKEITAGKKLKIGLPNYSNMEVSAYMVFDIGENETPDWNGIWDTINHQLWKERDSIDAAWIKGDELKNDYKMTIKVPKQQEIKGVSNHE